LREKKHTHIKNNIWYGNELSEYDTVQSTVTAYIPIGMYAVVLY